MRFPSVTLIAVAVLLSASLAACVKPAPVVQYAPATTVALAFALDDTQERKTSEAPQALVEAVQNALIERNLEVRVIPFASLAEGFNAVRDSDRRLEQAAAVADSDTVILIETRADFYSQLSGRYRWNVTAKLTVAARSDLPAAEVETLDLAAVLSYAHEAEGDAVAAIKGDIAKRAGRLFDRFFEGRSIQGTASPQAMLDSAKKKLIDKAPTASTSSL